MFTLSQIDHVALTVRDLERATRWYQQVLGLQRRHEEVWGDVPTMLYAGSTALALFPASVSDPAPAPGADTIAMRHLAFVVDRGNFRAAQEALTAQGIAFEWQDHTISHSIYFSDPDGHRLEITTYQVE